MDFRMNLSMSPRIQDVGTVPVDGAEILNKPPGMYKTHVNNGINYTPVN